MAVIINDGWCLMCKTSITNSVDGRQRPFCPECLAKLNTKIAAGEVGKKFPQGSLVFAPTDKDKE